MKAPRASWARGWSAGQALPAAHNSDGARKRRLANIVQGLVTGLASRFLGVAISFSSVPLTISYLTPEEYGIWTVLSALIAWLSLADLGIGSGLTNSVSEALGLDRPDLARNYISTAIFVLSAVSICMGAVVFIIWPLIDWVSILNIRTVQAKQNIGLVMAISIVIFLASFPLSIASRILNASQNSKIANYWSFAANIVSFLSLYAATQIHGGLMLLVLAVSGSNCLVQIIGATWLFSVFKPEFAPAPALVRRSSVRKVMKSGVEFFLIQILGLSIFQTDTILISHYLGASAVPTYSLTFRLFEYANIIQTVSFGYLWVAYAEAIARNDIDWVKKALRRTLLSSTLMSLISSLVLLVVAEPFIRFWSRGAIVPPFELVKWMCAWSVISSFCNSISCLLAAASHLKAQLVYGTLVASANLLLSILLIQRWGVSGAIAGTVLAYLLFNCIPTVVDVIGLVSKLEDAPSNKSFKS